MPRTAAASLAEPTTLSRFVAYYRVSTDKQGLRGLGMDAQRSAVADYLRRLGPDRATLIAEYVERESGKRSDRPELGKAMDHTKGAGATLLIAKLDRLSRDVRFLLGLRDAGLEFVACDMPDANRLTVTILAAVAEHEVKATSDRTKAALAEARKRVAVNGQVKEGRERNHPDIKRLGNPNGARALRSLGNAPSIKGVKVIKAKADARAVTMQRVIAGIRAVDGITSAKGIARKLNALGYRTPRAGSEWCAKAVIRLAARLDAISN